MRAKRALHLKVCNWQAKRAKIFEAKINKSYCLFSMSATSTTHQYSSSIHLRQSILRLIFILFRILIIPSASKHFNSTSSSMKNKNKQKKDQTVWNPTDFDYHPWYGYHESYPISPSESMKYLSIDFTRTYETKIARKMFMF